MDVLEQAESIFPYDTMRDAQVEGIEASSVVGEEEGYLVFEGECGTGKTLLSLSGLIPQMEANQFSRIVAATSVKQQMSIFEEEMRQINEYREENGEDKLFVVTLKGKGDLCPYVKHGAIDFREIQYECSKLRQGTRRKLNDAESKTGAAQRLQNAERSGNGAVTQFSSTGTYEYPFSVSDTPEGDFCPFYAGYLEERFEAMDEDGYDPEDVIPFDTDKAGVVSIEDMVMKSGEAGMCPHSILGEAMECADVIIGNYRHVFDEQTRHFTDPIIDKDTALVLDEAHNLVPTVRDIFSKRKTFSGISDDLTEILALREIVQGELSEESYWENKGDLASDVPFLMTGTDVDQAHQVIREIGDKSVNSVSEKQFVNCNGVLDSLTISDVIIEFANVLEEFYQTAVSYLESNYNLEREQEFNFQDPDELNSDNFTQWISLSNYGHIFSDLEAFGELITKIEDLISVELFDDGVVESDAEDFCRFFEDWYTNPADRYFRMAEVEEREYDNNSSNPLLNSWQSSHRLTLHVKNCLPRDEISTVLDEVGGGIIMSATLSPLEEYTRECGLQQLDRTVITRQFPLPFPKENRLSLGVTANKFKYSNRGDRWDSDQSWGSNQVPNTSNKTREEYAEIITATVEEVDGNVLIVMPSYPEGEWAAEVIKNETNLSENQILTDESSSNDETDTLKDEFFNMSNGVLVTGALGTLTEGVDYKGDRLSGAVICGVPLVNTSSDFHTAIQTTYNKYFEDDGYEFAFVLPAVRKSRQALGRVIRGADEKGVRILADGRYCPPETQDSDWDSVHHLLPESLQSELETTDPSEVRASLQNFW